MAPLNFNQQEPPAMYNGEPYLPAEPVLLTDFEEQRLAGQILNQLGGNAAVDRVKFLYQELTAYDPNRTNYVHYSNIQLVAGQLGVRHLSLSPRLFNCRLAAPGRGHLPFRHVQIRLARSTTWLRSVRRSRSVLRHVPLIDPSQSVRVSSTLDFPTPILRRASPSRPIEHTAEVLL